MQKRAERLMSRSETALLLDRLFNDVGRRGNRDLSLIHGLDQAVIVSATLSWICLNKNAWARVRFRAISGRHSRQAPLPRLPCADVPAMASLLSPAESVCRCAAARPCPCR